MRASHEQHLMVVALASALAVRGAYAQTPDSVQTRLGPLSFDKGFPTEEPSARSSTRSTTSEPCRPTCGPVRPFRSNPSGLRPRLPAWI